MASVIDKYNEELNLLIKKNSGEKITESVLKHFFVSQHNMVLEDMFFCQPDLEGLEKYEIWLDEGNKTW